MKQAILAQLTATKYCSIIVDATPDSSHVEQTSFILRYVHCKDKIILTKFKSAFLNLLIVTKKLVIKSIAELINKTLRKNGIHVPLADCRGQGYDNGSNMSGSYKGAQARIIQKNPLAKFCPCACLPQSKLMRGFCCRMLS